MGQNLSNGVYLPDEGERNCYSGLAANWNILNTAVGNIAGKASFSHTHGNITNDGKVGTTANLPLITGTGGAVQAGSFGNQANTFCEGNDSRLSDARTPVAHTHTKSDVTDLLNSNFIPSANNAYDLGSSSNQWNNLYAKNYYYNGVAWGLDKANTWTQSQTISINLPVFTLQDTIGVRNTTPTNARNLTFSFLDKNGDSYGFINRQHKAGTGTHLHQVSISNGTYDYRVQFYLYTDGKSAYIPSNDGVINLGTSTNKWKSFNGINPGALSFPDPNFFNIVDFSTTLNDITKETVTASKFSWTATVTGWMTIVWYVRNLTPPHRVSIYATSSDHDGDLRYHIFTTSFATGTPDYYLCSSFPAVAGVKYWFDTSFSNTSIGTVYHAYLLPCLGNV